MSLTDGLCEICGEVITGGRFILPPAMYMERVVCHKCATKNELEEIKTDCEHIFYFRVSRGKEFISNHYGGFHFKIIESKWQVGSEESELNIKFKDCYGNNWVGKGLIGVETAIIAQKETVIVIFRKMDDGDIIALFPEVIADMSLSHCQSYMHIGQHGAADVGLFYDTEKATPKEYAKLKKELEEVVGYDLKVRHKMLPCYNEARRKDYTHNVEQVEKEAKEGD